MRRAAAVGFLTVVAAAGCGGSDAASPAVTEPVEESGADAAASSGTSDDRPASVPSDMATATSDPTGSPRSSEPPKETEELPLVDARVLNRVDVGRGDLGFLISDGEALWATGADGVVVRIQPDSGEVDEVTVGDGSIKGQLLPTVDDDVLWLSAIQGSHVVRLDRTSLDADPPTELTGVMGLVLEGPDGQMWMERTGPPAALQRLGPNGALDGETVEIDAESEAVGSATAFGSLWMPLWDRNEVVRLGPDATILERIETGVGPAYVRVAADALWIANTVDGTLQRIDPDTLEIATVDLNAAGDTVERPSAITATSDAVWTRAGRLDDRRAIVFRIDPDSGEIVGRRTLPDGQMLDQLGGMAAVGDRLFVLDRPGRELLELNVDQFTDPHSSPPGTADAAETAVDADAVRQVEETVRTLLSRSTSPEQMAAMIVDGERLGEQVEAFKQFFRDNLPGENYEGDTPFVDVTGEAADVEFHVVVAGRPIVDAIPGRLVRVDGEWELTSASFCRLVATGDIPCPADLAADG